MIGERRGRAVPLLCRLLKTEWDSIVAELVTHSYSSEIITERSVGSGSGIDMSEERGGG